MIYLVALLFELDQMNNVSFSAGRIPWAFGAARIDWFILPGHSNRRRLSHGSAGGRQPPDGLDIDRARAGGGGDRQPEQSRGAAGRASSSSADPSDPAAQPPGSRRHTLPPRSFQNRTAGKRAAPEPDDIHPPPASIGPPPSAIDGSGPCFFIAAAFPAALRVGHRRASSLRR
jgi:hypothetical protein